MMHTGKLRDGSLLYPAMPCRTRRTPRSRAPTPTPSTRSSCRRPPCITPNRAHELRFPFNKRQLLLGWRLLFFMEGEYQPDPKQSAEWNRGAYLVEGLGHCSMCHTAINALEGNVSSKAFEGRLIQIQNWYAPSLTSNKEAGLGEWSIDEIVELLHADVSHKGAVYGPMAEVVYDTACNT